MRSVVWPTRLKTVPLLPERLISCAAVGWLNLWATILSAVFCVVGGWLSDRFGRRSTMALTMAATVVPTAILAVLMWRHGWIMPIPPDAPNRPVPATALVLGFWIVVLVFNVFQGLFYGIRTALFMDVTNPRVAATQFAAYMALSNLTISYTAKWQGWGAERWGYPATLGLDCALGLLFLLCLPFMVKIPVRKSAGDSAPA